MTNDPKDTIYIDVDDEITTVIDKLQNSPKKIVALVLPKRAAVFQSVVNMKLLKRTAGEAKKHVVLVTSEASLLPMAGAVGLHVAKTPQSKPEIPAPPSMNAPSAPPPEQDIDPDKAASVGSLALAHEEETPIQVDNSDVAPPSAGKKDKKPAKAAGVGKKKLKIPNFEKFRTKLLLGGVAGVVLVVGLVMALIILPKATITLRTDTTNIDSNLTVTADPDAQELDIEKGVIPALSKEFRKTDTEKVAATGEKDLGTKASGSITLAVDCAAGTPMIPAGTGVSADDLTYVTMADVTVASFPDNSSGSCKFKNAVAVTAGEAGAQYNLAAGKTFTVAGYSAVSGVNDNAMAGGTSKIVKVVTKDDIEKAKDAITKRAGGEAPEDLKEDITSEGYFPLEATLSSGNPTVTSTPAVGAESSEVTVTSTTVFTMLGVKQDDLKQLVEADAKKQIDTSKQVIRDNGLDDANIQVDKKGDGGRMTLSVQATVVAGPDINEDEIKKEVAGKKRGDIQNLLKQRPGVNEVEVDYSPFWVQSTPKSTSKITIVAKGTNKSNDADNDSP
jgi:hypothetical protein